MRQPSWLSEFSGFTVAGGWLAGWIRWQCQSSDINHQPPPLSAVSPLSSPLLSFTYLLLSSSCAPSAAEPVNTVHPSFCHSCTLSSSVYPCITFHLPLLLFLSPLSHMCIQGSSRLADSTGFVMNGILFHVRRKCMLQCGFTNCLHCPKNDSLYTAENGSQPDSQTDQQYKQTRLVFRVYRQTTQERQAER